MILLKGIESRKERRDEKIISWNTVKEFDAQIKADAIDRLLVDGS